MRLDISVTKYSKKDNGGQVLKRAIACKYCVRFTPLNCENRLLFHIVATGFQPVIARRLGNLRYERDSPKFLIAQLPNFYNRCNSPIG